MVIGALNFCHNWGIDMKYFFFLKEFFCVYFLKSPACLLFIALSAFNEVWLFFVVNIKKNNLINIRTKDKKNIHILHSVFILFAWSKYVKLLYKYHLNEPKFLSKSYYKQGFHFKFWFFFLPQKHSFMLIWMWM